jgi:hypothetical protein
MSSKLQFFGIKNRSCFYKLAKAHAIVSPLILASFLKIYLHFFHRTSCSFWKRKLHLSTSLFVCILFSSCFAVSELFKVHKVFQTNTLSPAGALVLVIPQKKENGERI